MAEQRYYVVGGEYADTSFTKPAPGAQLETHGPFSEREAKVFWRSITGKTVDNAMVRYVLEPEDQHDGKVYWVVGGEYADSNFTRLASGKEVEVFGPFEKSGALGFWRGLTAKTVDDALVRYDIRKNFHRGDGASGESSGSMRLAPSADKPLDVLTRTATKSIAIAAAPSRVFAFVMDGSKWPLWAIHNVMATRLLDNGTWELETKRGKGQLKLIGDATTGVIDQIFGAEGETWPVPGRVVPITGGSVLVLVFSKPATLSDEAFKQGMALLDEELAALKRAVEGL